ncbi:MAG: FHA domain-containing protein [Planctomycetota bacterium]
MSGYLTLADGSHRPVHDGFTIGRVAGCDLVIDDGKASRRHARLVVAGGVVEIEDLGSSNGTLLNDKPVQKRMLHDGDEVKIGKTVLVFHEGAPPGAAPAAAKGGGAAAAVFADDDDLLGGDAPAAPPASSPPPVKPPVRQAPMPVAATPPPPSPAPPAPPKAVVEFADEVVEVRRAEPTAPKAAAGKDATAAVRSAGRVLQFHKKDGGGGVLGDDLGQVGGSTKVLLYVGVLVLCAGLFWLTMALMG